MMLFSPCFCSDDGSYELSSTANGTSKIRLIRNFFDKNNADWIYEQLKTEIPWQIRINKKYNTEEPRMTCWIGEHPYIYSGVEWPALAVIYFSYTINSRL
jgi:hypothetical protein